MTNPQVMDWKLQECISSYVITGNYDSTWNAFSNPNFMKKSEKWLQFLHLYTAWPFRRVTFLFLLCCAGKPYKNNVYCLAIANKLGEVMFS